MTSELSQMLDELMGKNRNAAPDDKSNDMHWSDKDICKHFLCGFCPAELFTNTRSDLGPCEKIHDEAMRKAYQQSSRHMKMNYEADFLHYLQQCMQDVERRIKRNHQRLQLSEEKNQKIPNPSKDVEDQINILTQRIEEMLQKIEQLGNEGNVEEAQGVMKLCDQLKEDREQLYGQKGNVLDAFSVQEKQMEVCEVCGAFLIVGDAQSRVDDHLMGKQHMGYAKIKAQIEELKEKLRSKILPLKSEDQEVKRSSHSGHDDGRRQEKRSRSPRADSHGSKRRSSSHEGKRDRGRGHRSREQDLNRDRNEHHARTYDRRRDRDSHHSYGDRHRISGHHRSKERDHHSGSRSDKVRRSHRSRSRDRDRNSRKHSRPRSRSRDRKGHDRKDHKRSRRSDPYEEKKRRSEDSGDTESFKAVPVSTSAEISEEKTSGEPPVDTAEHKECQVSDNDNAAANEVVPERQTIQSDLQGDDSDIENEEPPAPGTAILDETAPGTEGDQ